VLFSADISGVRRVFALTFTLSTPTPVRTTSQPVLVMKNLFCLIIVLTFFESSGSGTLIAQNFVFKTTDNSEQNPAVWNSVHRPLRLATGIFPIESTSLLLRNTYFMNPRAVTDSIPDTIDHIDYLWLVGLSWNIVDDGGKPMVLLNMKTWNVPVYPSILRVERYLGKGFSMSGELAYNEYDPGKIINGKTAEVTYVFLATDINGMYDFCRLFDIGYHWFHFKKTHLNMYAAQGWGYTYRAFTGSSVGTCNVGVGMHGWILGGWGFNIQAMGKFGLTQPLISTSTNYKQYSFGVIYRFVKKEHFSAAGQERFF
jgi:hypothetical protein